MTKVMERRHKHCGGKVVGQSFCLKCNKWLVGDSEELKRKKKVAFVERETFTEQDPDDPTLGRE